MRSRIARKEHLRLFGCPTGDQGLEGRTLKSPANYINEGVLDNWVNRYRAEHADDGPPLDVARGPGCARLSENSMSCAWRTNCKGHRRSEVKWALLRDDDRDVTQECSAQRGP